MSWIRKTPMRPSLAWACLIGAALIPAGVSAMVPSTVSFQGYLRDDGGAPIEGSVNLSFRIYAAPTDGTALWTEIHGDVPISEGVFHVHLGSITPFPADFFSVPDRWIETIANGTTLLPRQTFTSTPFALRAAVAEVALSGGGDPLWSEAGGNIYRSGGNVGIGTAEPARGLHIQDAELNLNPTDLSNEDIVVESADAVVGLYSNTAGSFGSGIAFGEVSGGAPTNSWGLIRRTTGAGASLDLRYSSGGTTSEYLRVEADGDVGIGTSAPSNRLSVNGVADAAHLEAKDNLGAAGTPATGGVYADNVVYAWGRIRGDGAIEQGHGIESVTRLGAGWYRIIFKKSLANGVIPVVTVYSANDVVVSRIASASTDRCDVRLDLYTFVGGTGVFQATDYRFLIMATGRP